jgi:hypothetical protein
VIETLQQAGGLVGTLASGQLQPVPGLQRLALTRLAIQTTELQLGAYVTGTRRLTQQLLADTSVTGVATVTAQQLAKATLRCDHALARRLLEQAPGEMLDRGVVPQAGAVEQPEGQTNRQAITQVGLMLGGGQNARLHVSNGWLRGAPLYSLFPSGKDLPNMQNRALEQLLGQSTEAVDNYVDNLVETFLIAHCQGLSLKLMIFSPMKKLLIFH